MNITDESQPAEDSVAALQLDDPSEPVIIDTPDATGKTPPEPFFGPLRASVILMLFLLAQVIGALATFIGYVLYIAARGGDVTTPSFAGSVTKDALPAVLIVSLLTSGIVTFLASKLLARHLFRGEGRLILGWAGAAPRWIVIAVAAGFALAIAWVGAAFILPVPDSAAAGPLAKMAAGGGPGRHAWAFVGVFAAPLVEEFLFRGILFAGFLQRWGTKASAVIVTILFVSLHLPETFHYFPATIVVTALALATIVLRIRTGSLLPPVLAHTAYNLTIVLTAYFLTT